MTDGTVCSPVAIGKISSPLDVLLWYEISPVLYLLFFSHPSAAAAIIIIAITVTMRVFRRGHVRGLPAHLVLRTRQPLQHPALGRLVALDLVVGASRVVFGSPIRARSGKLLLVVAVRLGG